MDTLKQFPSNVEKVCFSGTIVHGKQLGRTLGFPTANLKPDPDTILSDVNGVYVATLHLEETGETLPCMLNQGRHPTVPEGPATVEAHILDFCRDLYGQRATVRYLEFLRPEQRFPSIDALKAQLICDCEKTQAYFQAHPIWK